MTAAAEARTPTPIPVDWRGEPYIDVTLGYGEPVVYRPDLGDDWWANVCTRCGVQFNDLAWAACPRCQVEYHEVTDVDAEPIVTGDDGATFILDGPVDLDARWGRGSEVLWATGESLMIAAPTGVGKTTVTGQLVAGLLGITDQFLGLPVKPARKVLYLAMDRPRQIRRSMRRQFGEDHRAILADRLVVRPGPLPTDLAKEPGQLVTLAQVHGCDVVIVDSLKDAAVKLTDDEVGGNINRAVQFCNAVGVDVLLLHHQRKGDGTSKPNTIADVYGSTWLVAGCGSVILLWGEAGGEQIELVHLKQPADPVGPWSLEHDHVHGTTSLVHAFDAIAYVRRHPGNSASQIAAAELGQPVKPGSKEAKRTERRLRRLEQSQLVRTDGQATDPATGHRTAAKWYPIIGATVDSPVDTPS